MPRTWGRWKAEGAQIAEGGQARLFAVSDMSGEHREIHALKELKNPKRQPRFRREMTLLLRFTDCPYIVPIVDADVSDDPERPAYVMPLADMTLARAVDTGQVDIDRAVEFFGHVCLGAAALHAASIVHRDLKPDNVLVYGRSAKLGDLGLAFEDAEERLTPVSEVVGPRFFCAPEFEDGRLDAIGPQADVYSLGKILYFLLTRGVVFSREKHRHRKYSLETRAIDQRSRLFEPLLDRSIVADRHQRFQDAHTMYGEYTHAIELYRAHPRTHLLSRYASLNAGIAAEQAELARLPPDQMEILIRHAIDSGTEEPPLTLLCSALSQLHDPALACTFGEALLAWESCLDPSTATNLAAAAVVSSGHRLAFLGSLRVSSKARILEIAARSADIVVLSAIAQHGMLCLKGLPGVAERIGRRLTEITPESRLKFLVGTYDLPWLGKQEFLLAHSETCENLTELEATVAGLCRCGTPEALATVGRLANRSSDEEHLQALVRGIALGASRSVARELREYGMRNRVLLKLLDLLETEEHADSPRDEPGEGGVHE